MEIKSPITSSPRKNEFVKINAELFVWLGYKFYILSIILIYHISSLLLRQYEKFREESTNHGLMVLFGGPAIA